MTLLLRIVPHYRVAFLDSLARRLNAVGLELQVLYGQERKGTQPPGVKLDAPWARCVPNIYGRLGSLEVVWQQGVRALDGSRLVVVEQANRLLANYVLQLRRRTQPFQLAYWGHGYNMQSRNPANLSERVKRRLLCEVDWWFAYTELSRSYILNAGFAAERITVVNNTVDSQALAEAARHCAQQQPRELARKLGCAGTNVALFCGTLHEDKRIDFLLQAARQIRRELPDFELLIVGDGPERRSVERAASEFPWIHYAGPDTSAARARYFHAAKLLLMPGLVGLVIVDSFLCGCPLVTTKFPFHSPEIAYLEPDHNGVIAPADVHGYAQAVTALMRNDVQLARLRRGCLHSAQKYSLQSMVENFAVGVEECLLAV
ncbi:MAG TPA: glycosyltransferase family 4 protein [Povalibacter sp.]|nr:glycosyltransferase family 4 protein [Povalibacter sp.]